MPWVYSADCQSPQVCAQPSRYNSHDSSTSRSQPGLFSNSYGGGVVKGTIFSDTWSFSALPDASPSPSLQNVNFGAVSTAFWSSSALASSAINGFIGLTVPSNQSSPLNRPVLPLLQLLAQRHLLQRNVFGFGPSSLTIGGYSPRYNASSLQWVPVLKSDSVRVPPYYWWIVALDSVWVDGAPYGPCRQSGQCQIMLDTGAGPMFVQTALQGVELPNSYPCGAASSLPTITFVIGGVAYPFSGVDYSLDVEGTCWNQISQANQTDSSSGASIDGSEMIMLQFGAPWFQKYYTVHDADQLQVGFTLLI